jgi:serine/threonine-protein kinase RsbW
MEMLLDSNLESVDQAEEAVLRLASEVGFDEDDLHRISVAVRESMVNAVVHGNRYNANKKVHLSVSAKAGKLTIRVGDEGDGFDASKLPDPLDEKNLLRQSGGYPTHAGLCRRALKSARATRHRGPQVNGAGAPEAAPAGVLYNSTE